METSTEEVEEGIVPSESEGYSFQLCDLVNSKGVIQPEPSQQKELDSLYRTFKIEVLSKKVQTHLNEINRVNRIARGKDTLPYLASSLVKNKQTITITGICILVSKHDLWTIRKHMKANKFTQTQEQQRAIKLQGYQERVDAVSNKVKAERARVEGTSDADIVEGPDLAMLPESEQSGNLDPIMPQADEMVEIDTLNAPEEPSPDELRRLVSETLGVPQEELTIDDEKVSEQDPHVTITPVGKETKSFPIAEEHPNIDWGQEQVQTD